MTQTRRIQILKQTVANAQQAGATGWATFFERCVAAAEKEKKQKPMKKLTKEQFERIVAIRERRVDA